VYTPTLPYVFVAYTGTIAAAAAVLLLLLLLLLLVVVVVVEVLVVVVVVRELREQFKMLSIKQGTLNIAVIRTDQHLSCSFQSDNKLTVAVEVTNVSLRKKQVPLLEPVINLLLPVRA
jgi:hypothetical protein